MRIGGETREHFDVSSSPPVDWHAPGPRPYTARALDNLTHSLVGLLAAETVIRARERGSLPERSLEPWTRSALYVLSIVGNNLPDIDLTYSRISGKTIGYLLHHRGYTHTLPAAILFAALMMGLVVALAKRRSRAITRGDFWLLASVALFSPLLHIAMDFGNAYGVHPFWPVYDGWIYGDAFFIFEPSFWLIIIAPLTFSLRTRTIRIALWVMLTVAVAAVWYRPMVPRGNAVVLSLLTLGLLMVARKMRPAARLVWSLAGFLGVALAFVIGSRLAKAAVSERTRAQFPSAEILDVVAAPMPANPFCWSMLLVERDTATYFVRLGWVAVFPAWLDVDACPYDRSAEPTAPLTPLTPLAPGGGNRVRLIAEYQVALSELRALPQDRCEARAFLRFARVPYFSEHAPDRTRIIGDLRYDREPGLDFSDLQLPAMQGRCPPYVPPWLPPRSDLLLP